MPVSPRAARSRSQRLELGQGPTHRPLQCLVFISPLLLIYQIGSFVHPWDPTQPSPVHVIAFTLLLKFFAAFGALGTYMPLLAVIGVLLAWHLARKDKWDFEPSLYIRMAVESILWAVPIFTLSLFVQQGLSPIPQRINSNPTPHTSWIAQPAPPLAAALPSASSSHLSQLPIPNAMIIAIGAGIYEELIFRLIAITMLSLFFVDILELKLVHALPLMILISAFLFAIYHKLGAIPLNLSWFLFLMAFGIYCAGIFLFRGFGIAVGTHAVYDLIVIIATYYHHPPP